jgi:hypothetical protein
MSSTDRDMNCLAALALLSPRGTFALSGEWSVHEIIVHSRQRSIILRLRKRSLSPAQP